MPASLFRSLAVLILSGLPLLGQAETACRIVKLAELPLRFATGSMQPALDISINGKPATMLFDTGASGTMLHRRGVEQLNLRLQNNGPRARGVGGETRMSTTHLNSFAIGPAEVRNFYMAVLNETTMSPDVAGLLGVDLTLRDDLELDLAHAAVRLFRPEGCATTSLGYWGENVLSVPLIPNPRHELDHRPFVEVELNGHKVAALVDTGAARSVVQRKAAERAGIDLNGPGVKALGWSGGVGAERIKVWGASFKFKLGAEEVANAPIRIMDDNSSGFAGADMLLGQDWLLAHRVLISTSQEMFYFSYSGGQPFGDGAGEPWFAALARGGNLDAQYALGSWLAGSGQAQAGGEWLRKAADSGHPRASYRLANELVMQGRYADAVPYLKSAATKLPREGWPDLWLYVAQARSGGPAAARTALEAAPVAAADQWPAPIAAFYLGRIGQDKLQASAGDDRWRQCDVQRYLGLWYLAQGDAAQEAAQRQRAEAACHAP